ANLGSHRRQKGQFELIQAFSRVFAQQRNIRLWLVGEGPDTPALRERAQQLRLTEPEADPPCRFFGWQKADQVRLLLGSCDLVVHPTHSEAFPQVMVEALIHQRPLVITPVSGVKEWLRHPQDAWIIPIQDEAALQEALTVLVTNKALRQEMGRQAAARLRSQLAYSTVNAHYETLYQRLCSR
ncbi:MAG: glycosyltransferase, partial [Bacteroidetes bacterium]